MDPALVGIIGALIAALMTALGYVIAAQSRRYDSMERDRDFWRNLAFDSEEGKKRAAQALVEGSRDGKA